jgi:chitodextrinase
MVPVVGSARNRRRPRKVTQNRRPKSDKVKHRILAFQEGDMSRNLFPLMAALALASCVPSAPKAAAAPLDPPAQLQSQPQAQAQSQALVGTWSATVNWNLRSGLMIITTFTADGHIQSTVENHMGMSFTLAGVYQFNAAQSTLSYTWQDFSPKQTCVGGACTPAQPPAPMGVETTNSIRFLSATEFVATSNGASTLYVRTNAAGVPTP